MAPTIDQVEAVLNKTDLPGCNIQRFVAAMVDAKIARADVANAVLGDRRFAFAHRRYQEALFVRHLVAHPGYLSGYELLTDPRWREYAVTLLETQPAPALNEIFDAAVRILMQATSSQRRQDALSPLNSYCGYFEWTSEAAQTLTLLQEGLARRVSTIPVSLSIEVERFLDVRWNTGDSFDRIRIMRVAALLPQATLGKYLEQTFLNGSDRARDEGFKQTASLIGNIPATVRYAVLQRLADEILGAKDLASLLRVEALIARLPRDLGAEYVQRRCLLLWRLTSIVSTTASLMWPNALIGIARSLLHPKRKIKNAATLRTRGALMFGIMVVTYIPVLLSMALIGPRGIAEASTNIESLTSRNPLGVHAWIKVEGWAMQAIFISALAVMLIYLIFPVLFRFRAAGESLNLKFFFSRLGRRKAAVEILKFLAVILLGMGVTGTAMYLLGIGVSYVASLAFSFVFSAPPIVIGMAALTSSILASVIVVEVISRRRKRTSLILFTARFRNSPGDTLKILVAAESWKQLESWISFWHAAVQSGAAQSKVDIQMRSLSAFLQQIERGGAPLPIRSALGHSVPSKTGVADCINLVEQMGDHFAAKPLLDIADPGHVSGLPQT